MIISYDNVQDGKSIENLIFFEVPNIHVNLITMQFADNREDPMISMKELEDFGNGYCYESLF